MVNVKNRSKGIIILALWLVLDGLNSILFSVFHFFSASHHGIKLPLMLELSGYFIIICGILSAVCGVGLFMLKEWARIATVGVVFSKWSFWWLFLYPKVASYASDVSVAKRNIDFLSSVAFCCIVTLFLTRKKVAEQFKAEVQQ